VEGLGEVRQITIGPFAVGLGSVTAKSGTTFAGADRECAPPPPPPPPPPPDACPNIAGDQATVPVGMVKDAPGNCVTVPGAPVVDLEIVKTDSPDPVSVGRRITYAIRVTNRGPAAATNVVVTDPLPGLVGFVSAGSSQGSCTTSQPIRCVLGRIENGGSATITIVVRASGIGLTVNAASVADPEADPNTANNTSVATTRIVAPFQPPNARCDGLTVSPRALRVGRTATVTIRATVRGRPVRVLVLVLVRGAGVVTSWTTSRAGTRTIRVRPMKAGIVRFFVRGTGCERRLGAVAVFQPPLTG
jgi:uncharacterized repeat protein (TIGR01451 family)